MNNYNIVRFGNVIGSSGSVVPKFLEQISHGGPVTVTHPEINRYFMSISEAVYLVINSSCYMSHRNLFVLDMGQPRKILEVAKELILNLGFPPQMQREDCSSPKDILIQFTGLRLGEKLYEELVLGDELAKTDITGLLKGREPAGSEVDLTPLLQALSGNPYEINSEKLIALVKQACTEYQFTNP